ncbi:MAG: hypothetical protein IPG46_18155 [Actinobacteria bacterium]|nr:hypothetical protein [Actinomycetota bacterium]
MFFSTGASIPFSGFIGTGKSTELRRLRRRLEGDGNLVLLIDMEPLLNPTAPLDITVFLTRLAGGVENEAIAQCYIDASTTRQRFSRKAPGRLSPVGSVRLRPVQARREGGVGRDRGPASQGRFVPGGGAGESCRFAAAALDRG